MPRGLEKHRCFQALLLSPFLCCWMQTERMSVSVASRIKPPNMCVFSLSQPGSKLPQDKGGLRLQMESGFPVS